MGMSFTLLLILGAGLIVVAGIVVTVVALSFSGGRGRD